jgi:two-component system chemotaxis sensor kinase CheA
VARRFQAIRERFEERVASVEELVTSEQAIELSQLDYDELRAGLTNRKSVEELLPVVEAWRWLQISQVLARLGAQARRVAVRLDKSVEISMVHGDLRIAPGPLDDFVASLVHVIRNALDHGIETADERQALGKPELGRLQLRSYLDPDDKLVLEIEDDGRGIDFAALKGAAARAGLPAKSREELLDAMLRSGVTTRAEASELSGRGVGLAAVAHACRQAGGDIHVHSDAGQGTLFRFSFPPQRVQVRLSLAGSKVKGSQSKLRTAVRQ